MQRSEAKKKTHRTKITQAIRVTIFSIDVDRFNEKDHVSNRGRGIKRLCTCERLRDYINFAQRAVNVAFLCCCCYFSQLIIAVCSFIWSHSKQFIGRRVIAKLNDCCCWTDSWSYWNMPFACCSVFFFLDQAAFEFLPRYRSTHGQYSVRKCGQKKKKHKIGTSTSSCLQWKNVSLRSRRTKARRVIFFLWFTIRKQKKKTHEKNHFHL